jgi:uncharacterized RDD family membrane protein YckC
MDKLTIDTPEQMSLDYSLAGIGSRFLALAYDTLIQFVATAALGILVLVTSSFTLRTWTGSGAWTLALLLLGWFLIQFGYFAFFEATWNGQTPGKRHVQLRVIKDDGRPITSYDAVARNLVRIVDYLPGIYGIGILSVLLSSKNKRLGDYVAGTVVVHEKELEGIAPQWAAPEPAAAESGPVYEIARLSPGEMQLVETFLERRDSLEAPLRRQSAFQIATRVANTLGLPDEERRTIGEPFLESVQRQYRNSARYHK